MKPEVFSLEGRHSGWRGWMPIFAAPALVRPEWGMADIYLWRAPVPTNGYVVLALGYGWAIRDARKR